MRLGATKLDDTQAMAEKLPSYVTKLKTGRPQFWIGAVLAMVVLCVGTARSLAVSFSAALDRDTVLVGETVSLTLKCEGGALKAIPPLPQVPGLQFAQSVSSAMNSTLGPDGKMTTVHSYTLNFVPQQAGDLVIPAITAEIEGQKFTKIGRAHV